jgi:hypothetical protein
MPARDQRFLARIAAALERLAPAPPSAVLLGHIEAFVWHADTRTLLAVETVNRVALELLKGIDRQRDLLLANTRRFAEGFAANNALLWGARGMGKSSLIKAVHGAVNEELSARGRNAAPALALIEIHREDIAGLPDLLAALRRQKRRVLVFCDDLSFDGQDSTFKSLKAALEGGIEGRPDNVLFYATSNRRHLMPREAIENERGTALNPAEVVDEKVSLSDRFGLWLGFHTCDQDTYFAIVEAYAASMKLAVARDDLLARANEWSVTRGGRSGRVAWQFIQDLAGELAENGRRRGR